MKRALIAATILLVLLIPVWVYGSALSQGAVVYTVQPRSDGEFTLVLRVERPGLFVDLQQLPGGVALPGAFSPWPRAGERKRIITLFQGPLELPLAQGTGPFDLSNLPAPVYYGPPGVRLPKDWRQAGRYAGRFDVVEGSPVSVAVPAGTTDAVEKVHKLYAAAETLFARPPVREKLAVVAGPQPEHVALAVSMLWVPDLAADAEWLETGAAQFYAVKLLDQTKLWTSKERDRWFRANEAEKPYALTIWLDATMRLDRAKKQALGDLLQKAGHGRTSAELVSLLNETTGLAAADKLERMLNGKDPLPVTR